MNGYDNKIVEGEILRVPEDHSAAAYLKEALLLCSPRTPSTTQLIETLIHEGFSSVPCYFIFFPF